MSFSATVKQDSMVACGRHCCLCHKFCGIKMEIHHILEVSEGGDDTPENAIPLCFDCHADMRSYDHNHPKGTKYLRNELKRHRDNWYQKIAGNIGVVNREEIVAVDKIVFQTLFTLLPWHGSIDYIRTFDFAGAFPLHSLDDLYNFKRKCVNPTFEFIEPDLEGKRSSLLSLVDAFTMVINAETFPTRGDLNAVPKEWRTEQLDRFNKVASKLNEIAQEIVDTYDDLARMGVRKLGVLLLEANPDIE